MSEGQLAYEAFREKAFSLGIGNQASLPEWVFITSEGQECWQAAALAVIMGADI